MNNENKSVIMEDNTIYYYFINSVKYWTPNYIFAQSRATYHSDGNVYMEKND